MCVVSAWHTIRQLVDKTAPNQGVTNHIRHADTTHCCNAKCTINSTVVNVVKFSQQPRKNPNKTMQRSYSKCRNLMEKNGNIPPLLGSQPARRSIQTKILEPKIVPIVKKPQTQSITPLKYVIIIKI